MNALELIAIVDDDENVLIAMQGLKRPLDKRAKRHINLLSFSRKGG